MCKATGGAHLIPLEMLKDKKGIYLLVNGQQGAQLIQLKIVKWSPSTENLTQVSKGDHLTIFN